MEAEEEEEEATATQVTLIHCDEETREGGSAREGERETAVLFLSLFLPVAPDSGGGTRASAFASPVQGGGLPADLALRKTFRRVLGEKKSFHHRLGFPLSLRVRSVRPRRFPGPLACLLRGLH